MINTLPRWIVLGAFILALVAGMVNSVALLALPQLAVSHMTGAIGMLGESFIRDGIDPWAFIRLVFGFFVGAVCSGIIVGNERLAFGRRYGIALLFQSLILVISCGLYRLNSPWGPGLAAMACGLQNAMVSTYSGATIRTTHLTGVISDLGSLLGNAIRRMPVSRRHVILLIEIVVGFITGTVLSALLFDGLGAFVLLIPAGLCAASAMAYLVWRKKSQKSPQ